MKYFIVDAFTTQPFGGNPAGVVMVDSYFPSEKFMQQVAAEFRYSETAFVRRDGENEFTVRYFTPRGEVDLCGHATVATFGTLYKLGIIDDGTMCINHTLAGNLQVRVGDKVMMEMAEPQIIDVKVDVERLHSIMGVKCPHNDLPVMVVSTGLTDIMMPVSNVDELNSLVPNMEALAQFNDELNVTGVHAFALSDNGFTAHVRNFAPLYGIPEESATGTANGALTHYLHHNDIISSPANCNFLQGEAMKRPSVVATSLLTDGAIWVGGDSTIIAIGEIIVDS
ncbi:MAG: PhzF family phenazine biosynthesis protein [Muribaculaceae bacterium]|nr:PhzF family phenazine biosynthesis protein [Muribaculaceae bacterium]